MVRAGMVAMVQAACNQLGMKPQAGVYRPEERQKMMELPDKQNTPKHRIHTFMTEQGERKVRMKETPLPSITPRKATGSDPYGLKGLSEMLLDLGRARGCEMQDLRTRQGELSFLEDFILGLSIERDFNRLDYALYVAATRLDRLNLPRQGGELRGVLATSRKCRAGFLAVLDRPETERAGAFRSAFQQCKKFVHEAGGHLKVMAGALAESDEVERTPETGKIVSGMLLTTPVPDFFRLTNDKCMAELLNKHWTEIEVCMESGACLAAIILMGSILEGVLYALAKDNPRDANTAASAPKDQGKHKVFSEWHLNDFINVAHECGWIQHDAKEFSHSLREYRNLVHPRKQLTVKSFPDADTCMICLNVLQAAMNDVATLKGIIS